MISGVPVEYLSLRDLRRYVHYLPQSVSLFTGSVAYNLVYGRGGHDPIEQEEIWEALDLVGMASFVRHLPDGLGSTLGDIGHALSDGQRQRLALARAVLTRPRILILDEATSTLDVEGEERVLRGVRQSLPCSTIIVVSHRLSSISWCDKVIVLQDGKLSDQGPPTDLRARSALYNSLLQAV